MIDALTATAPTITESSLTALCIHGHFYQPPREDPFTGTLLDELGAAPFRNFNEKITTECYQPNAEVGNFDLISFDLGPTLAAWLEQAHPDIYQRIIQADYNHRRRYGVGNAMAQAYNHTILPLATTRDKQTQIRWGLQDFTHRYGRPAHGMWLAESAVDFETLDILAQHGVTYTILAPWQAQGPIDPSEPYILPLRAGRSMMVFFYNASLSGGVSFDWNITNDANAFAHYHLPAQLTPGKRESGKPQILMVATDGELYGHHKPWRDMFLSYLLEHSAPQYGFDIYTPERYMQLHPPTREVQIYEPSAWSCSHGVARWSTGCGCTEGDSSWKRTLRQALQNLSERGDQLFEQAVGEVLQDPWTARDDYLALRNGWESLESFWTRHAKDRRVLDHPQLAQRTRLLLEAQYYQQYSFTSCGFFFEDLDRIEPRNDIAFARRAISLVWQALGVDLQRDFLSDLKATRSWRTGRTGADLYRHLPAVPADALPQIVDN